MVEHEAGLARLDQALAIIDVVAGTIESKILATVAERCAVLRRFSPRTSTSHDPPLAATELLKVADRDGVRVRSSRLPIVFLLVRCRWLISAIPSPGCRL